MELQSKTKLLLIYKLSKDANIINLGENNTSGFNIRKILENLTCFIQKLIDTRECDKLKYPELLSLSENIETDYKKIEMILNEIIDSNEKNDTFDYDGKSKSIMMACYKILIDLQNYEKYRIEASQNRFRNSFKSTFAANNSGELLKSFSELCNCTKDLQILAQQYNKDLISSKSIELEIIFKNIFKFINIASVIGKMKISYQNDFQLSKQFSFNFINFNLEKLLYILNISKEFEKLSYFREKRNFLTNIDQAINFLQTGQNDVSINDKVSEYLQEIINYGKKIAQFCRQPVQTRIIESCVRLSEKQSNSSCVHVSNWICFNEEMVDEIETLEKIVNMGVLRLVFDLVTISNIVEKRLLKAAIKLADKKRKTDEKTENNLLDFEKCLNEFENYKDRLILVILITSECSSNIKITRRLKLITLQLESIVDEYMKAFNEFIINSEDVAVLYHIQLIREEWRTSSKIAIDYLLSLIDVIPFLQLTDCRMNEILSDVEDQISESELSTVRLSLSKIIQYSMSALLISKTFMKTDKGRNGRKAINLGRDQIVCGMKMLKLSFQKYIENIDDEEKLSKVLSFSKILRESLQKLLSTCIEVTSSNIYDTETASQSYRESVEYEETNELRQSESDCNILEANITAENNSLQSFCDNPDEDSPLEFGITDILEELSTGSYFSNVSSFNKNSINECLRSNGENVLKDKQKQLLLQVKNLEIEVKQITGFPLLNDISFSLCAFISDFLSRGFKTFDKSWTQSVSIITGLLKKALCEVTNTRLLYEFSCLLQHFEIASQQIECFETVAKLNEQNEQVDDLTVNKLTNTFKQLIKTLELAKEESIIIQKSKTKKSFSKQFRGLGFDSSVGYFNQDLK